MQNFMSNHEVNEDKKETAPENEIQINFEEKTIDIDLDKTEESGGMSEFGLDPVKEKTTKQKFSTLFLRFLRVIIFICGAVILCTFMVIIMLGFQERIWQCRPVANQLARFKKVHFSQKSTKLTENEKKIVEKLKSAQNIINTLFLQQVYNQNEEVLKILKQENFCSGPFVDYFHLNFGPWSRVDDNKMFFDNKLIESYFKIHSIPLVKPPGANFYPLSYNAETGVKKFEEFVNKLNESEKIVARGFYSIIKQENETIKLVPYNIAYEPLLKSLSKILLECAALSENASLKKYFTSRANSFLNNDYYTSDVDWLKIDDASNLELVVGPYATNEDMLLNLKSSFELIVGVVDREETESAKIFTEQLEYVQANLPYNASASERNTLRPQGKLQVIDMLFNAGHTAAGIQTISHHLPRDPKVADTLGTKRLFLKNVHDVKFEAVLAPIAEEVIETNSLMYINENAFYYQTLCHELLHGIGPYHIKVGNNVTNVRDVFGNIHTQIEEAKADVGGLWMITNLVNNDRIKLKLNFSEKLNTYQGMHIKEKTKRCLYVTFLANLFRTVRFGSQESDGSSTTLIFGHLLEHGGLIYEDEYNSKIEKSEKRFSVNFSLFEFSVASLFEKILTIQAKGDVVGATSLLKQYSTLNTTALEVVERISKIPVDIFPQYGSLIAE